MHTIAHGGCTNTIKGLSLKADFGEKILAAPGSRGLYKYHKRACIESWLWNNKSLLHQGVGGCTNTTKGLASKADFGITNPCCTRESGAVQIPQKGLHWKLTLEEKILTAPGSWTHARSALDLTWSQMSYIPTFLYYIKLIWTLLFISLYSTALAHYTETISHS